MVFNNDKYNIIILFCIFFMINACNKNSPKIIVENSKPPKTNANIKIKDVNKKNNYLKKEVLKEKIEIKKLKKK